MNVDIEHLPRNEKRMCFTVGETATHWVDIMPMIFNHRIVLTPKANPICYDVGWCYPDLLAAVAALNVWDPDTQPEPVGYLKRVGELRRLELAPDFAEKSAAAQKMWANTGRSHVHTFAGPGPCLYEGCETEWNPVDDDE